ncbi:MAG: hypothetical protein FJZ00_08195, partial [Candidatus Sericytochromatia bacterium]|nr:hypothetical protein [Candidatus Tanganyikabacteria bacterium]
MTALRRGEWVILDADAAGASGAQDPAGNLPIAPVKLSLSGSGRIAATVRAGTTLAFVDPGAAKSTIAALAPSAAPGRDVTVWDLTGAKGRTLRLVGPGDGAAAAKVLGESPWVPAAAARARSNDGSDVVWAASGMEGGFAVIEAARRLAKARSATWVDGGNLVEDSNDARGHATLERTLASLPDSGVAMVVPFKNELRLSPADQIRLARAVPLVAANLAAPADVPLRAFTL